VSSIFYQRKSKTYLLCFFWIYNDLYVITSHKSIPLNFVMKKYFWTPYLPINFKNIQVPYFNYCNFFQIFYSTYHKLNGMHNKFWVNFFLFMSKSLNFKLYFGPSKFLYIFYHAFIIDNLKRFHICIRFDNKNLDSMGTNPWVTIEDEIHIMCSWGFKS
jgi:hypothetical protein